MRYPVLAVFICLTTLTHTACSWMVYYPDVSIRVQNASNHVFDSVVVGFPSRSEDYGRIEPHRASTYRTVSEAYTYAYVKVVANNRTFEIRPIDFVGEVPLMPGRYTYRLTVTEGKPDLGLKFVSDR